MNERHMTAWRASLLLAFSILASNDALAARRADSPGRAAPPPAQPATPPQSDVWQRPQLSRGTLRQTQYVDAAALDLTRLIPPPPTNDSAETRAELDQMLTIQKTRTPAQVARATADADVNVNRFADAFADPPGFDVKNLPRTQSLFRKIGTDERVVVGTGKDGFARPRPFVLEPRLQPVVKTPPNGSYPSGHTMWSYTVGLVLADMVPERRAQLMARAAEYAQNRVIAGVHYPSDIEGGKMAATAFAAALFASPAFQSDLAAAKAELRKALDLSPALTSSALD